ATGLVKCNLRNYGCYQTYTNGAIVWNASTGAWESYGPIRERWATMGFESGELGYPTGAITCGLVDSGCWQGYEKGYIVWSANTGAWESKGGIRNYWKSIGSESGELGYPTGAEVVLSDGWFQKYENGYIVGK